MADPLASMMLAGGFMGDNPQQSQMPVNVGYQANGPAAVPFINQAMQNYQAVQDRSLRASDTANAYNEFFRQQAEATAPNMEAARKLGLSQTALEQSTYDSGKQAILANSGLDAKTQQSLASADSARLARYDLQSQGWLRVKSLAEIGPMTNEKKKLIQQTAKEYGIADKMPDPMSEEFYPHVLAGANMATQIQPHVQKLQEIEATGGQAQKTAAVTGRYSLEGAKEAAAASRFATQATPGYATNQALQHISEGSYTKGDAAALTLEALKSAGPGIYNSPALTMLQSGIIAAGNDLSKEKDPKERERKQQIYNDLIKGEADFRKRAVSSMLDVGEAKTGVPSPKNTAAPTGKVPPPGRYHDPVSGKDGTWDGKTFIPDK